MTNHAIEFRSGDRVKLRYRLCAELRHYCDESAWEQMNEAELGSTQIPAWIEDKILNGELVSELSAEQVSAEFGDYDDAKILMMPRSEFAADIELCEGLIMAFATPTGDELAGRIDDFTDEVVAVDFNHPFSGTSVILEVEIQKI